MLARERPGSRRRAWTASHRGGGPAQRPVAGIHAIQGAHERKRLHPVEDAQARLPARRELTKQDAVVGVPRTLQRCPGGVEQVPIKPRTALDRKMSRCALGSEARAIVRLVLYRPEVNR